MNQNIIIVLYFASSKSTITDSIKVQVFQEGQKFWNNLPLYFAEKY